MSWDGFGNILPILAVVDTFCILWSTILQKGETQMRRVESGDLTILKFVIAISWLVAFLLADTFHSLIGLKNTEIQTRKKIHMCDKTSYFWRFWLWSREPVCSSQKKAAVQRGLRSNPCCTFLWITVMMGIFSSIWAISWNCLLHGYWRSL